jgi:hypothetical protein
MSTLERVEGFEEAQAIIDELPSLCRWCKSANCTFETSPHCYCLDCGAPLSPCKCRYDCPGGNCYRPGCGEPSSTQVP